MGILFSKNQICYSEKSEKKSLETQKSMATSLFQ